MNPLKNPPWLLKLACYTVCSFHSLSDWQKYWLSIQSDQSGTEVNSHHGRFLDRAEAVDEDVYSVLHRNSCIQTKERGDFITEEWDRGAAVLLSQGKCTYALSTTMLIFVSTCMQITSVLDNFLIDGDWQLLKSERELRINCHDHPFYLPYCHTAMLPPPNLVLCISWWIPSWI